MFYKICLLKKKMRVEVHAIGGYNFIGSNMTGIIIDDIGIIIDMGASIDKISLFGESKNIKDVPLEELYANEVIPDDRNFYEKYKDKIKAIILTHGHLDHIGSVGILSAKYNAPIYCTPYTYSLLKEDFDLINDVKKVNLNSSIKIGDLEIEFINMTHSIPHNSMIDIKTDKGHIVFSSDFKFDNFPIIGKRPDYKKLKKIGDEGVRLLIVETTRADEQSKSPSEVIERYLLYDVLNYIDTKGVIISTFSSHIARLKTIGSLAKELGREPIFVGRSIDKYISAAEDSGILKFKDKYRVYGDIKDYAKILEKEVQNNKENYLLVATGHQGEPGSVLDKIARGDIEFDLSDTTVIFANNVIPTPINEANRKILEERLKKKGAKIIRDVHVTGHARVEDHIKLLHLLQPENIIPNHGDILKKASYYNNVAYVEGYQLGTDIFFLDNGRHMVFDF